ncbi:MAG: c-type cytochrome [Verrucomicrobia bacterium]|nr:c-type cytochrome [Verrucomicrobiota bacterium]
MYNPESTSGASEVLVRVSGWTTLAMALTIGAVMVPVPARAASTLPKVDLPDGLELVVAAAPPLVNYPIMGCLDDRGRMFLGDAAGLNLDRKELEAQLPNRVLVLEDTDGDGKYDRTTVFADKMNFPHGGCWIDGSLYVADPPGIWKLTDTNGDSIADRRELIVGGFDETTGNGTQIHGPFLHPANGRLYWCGNRSAKVVQKDGTPVRDGRATGVWSSKSDGSEIEWHSLGGMANAVEVDFTAEGEMVGVVNIHYLQPRGDTLVHWLYGGVYERADSVGVRSSALADLPHTLEKMPVTHNFGHVAVSGFLRYRSGALNPSWKNNLFVTFFNTQKLVRVQLVDSGATYEATEHEFLKLQDPDSHFTDVIEDADGSLLVLDTGGWFRRGCPASLSSKPDFRGAVYRIRRKNHMAAADPYGLKIHWGTLAPAALAKLRDDDRWMVRERAVRLSAAASAAPAVSPRELLDPARPRARRQAWESIARSKRIDAGQREALGQTLAEPLEPALEHAAMFAAIATNAFAVDTLRGVTSSTLARRLFVVLEQSAKDPLHQDSLLSLAKLHFDSSDVELARTAVALAARHPRAIELCYEDLSSRLAQPRLAPATGDIMMEVTAPHLPKPQAQKLVAAMLQHPVVGMRRTAWRIIARQSGNVSNPLWFPPLEKHLVEALSGAGGADLQLLLDAISRLQTKHFDQVLKRIMDDAQRPQPTRVKALAALSRRGEPLNHDAFGWLLETLKSDASATARVDAARFLSRARLNKEQLRALAPVLATAGPVELMELLSETRKKIDAETGRLWAASFAKSPVFGSIEESVIRSSFQSLTAQVYEDILGPAVRVAAAANDAKKRKLETLAGRAAQGRATEGRTVFEISTCAACHKAGNWGRAMGPDLSRIGHIRQPRDLLESILFPNATIAPEFETHLVETADGQSFTGTVKNETADTLVLLDLAGQEKSIPRAQILGNNLMPASLMPTGLEQAFTDQQLLDLVAWLGSLK